MTNILPSAAWPDAARRDREICHALRALCHEYPPSGPDELWLRMSKLSDDYLHRWHDGVKTS